MENERQVLMLNIDDILPNRFQPRIKFNEQAINELAESIKLHGVIQPIVVRKISDKYEIIAGERRYKASILAGKTTIPAIITSLDDKNSAEVALIENVQRQDLTPIEEAISYKKILDMGYISQGDLGEKLGKKQSTIANKLRLLNLNDEVQEALMENKISERHARSLLKLDEKKQILMLNRIVNERLTVRKTDEEIEKLLNNTDSSEDSQKVKEEKGEIIMNNNEVLKEFNIPTDPIIDDSDNSPILFEEASNSPIEQNNQPIETINPVVENSVNPGFMDVEKIQNEAQDIIQEPAPVADMDKLLQPDMTTSATSIMEQVEQTLPPAQEMPQPTTGKFFNMFNFDEQSKNENFVENVEEQQVNMDFGEPTYTVPNAFNPITDNLTNNQPVEIKNVENSVEAVESEYPDPIVEPFQPEMAEPVAIQSSDVPIQSIEEQEPVTPFGTPVNSYSLTDDQTFSDITDEMPSQQIEEVTSIPEEPAPNMINNQINKSYMLDDSVQFDADGEIEVKIDNPNERYVTADMKTVINTIRNCATTIEKFGYKVETDEMDLTDTYEVTFRIDKNV